jgi:hypothetical protein
MKTHIRLLLAAVLSVSSYGCKLSLTLQEPLPRASGLSAKPLVPVASVPTVSFLAVGGLVRNDEGAGVIRAALQLDRASESTLKVPVSVISGSTATTGSDYTLDENFAYFAPGETSATVQLSVMDDLVDEDDESIKLALGVGQGFSVSSTSSALTVTLIDNDAAPTVGFSAVSQEVSESVGTVSVAASLSAASSRTVNVPYAVSGTAVYLLDHDLSGGTLSFPPGATSASVSFKVLADSVNEPSPETIVLTLGAPVNATLGSGQSQSHTVSISDVLVGKPQASFEVASSEAQESAGTIKIKALLNSPAPSGGLAVGFELGGTATRSADYTLDGVSWNGSSTTSGTLAISAGATSGTFSLSLVNDLLDENDETVTLTLQAGTAVALGAISQHTFKLFDDDSAPTLAFEVASVGPVSEGSGTVQLKVILSASSSKAVSATVGVLASGSSATPGSDFTAPPSTVSIAAGSTQAVISLQLTDDSVVENEEVLVLQLSSPQNATLGQNSSTTVRIQDNEPRPTATPSPSPKPSITPSPAPSPRPTASSSPSSASIYLMAGAGGRISASTDGKTFNDVSEDNPSAYSNNQDGDDEDLIRGGCVGKDGSGKTLILLVGGGTSNGRSGVSGYPGRISRSYDGKQWEQVVQVSFDGGKTYEPRTRIADSNWMGQCAYDGSRFVIATGGTAMISADGEKWIFYKNTNTRNTSSARAATWGGGVFVTARWSANGSEKGSAWSNDGLTWTLGTFSGSSGDGKMFRSVAAGLVGGRNRFVLGGDGPVQYSDNGREWMDAKSSAGGTLNLSALQYYAGKFYGASGSKLATSDDGITWTVSSDSGSGSLSIVGKAGFVNSTWKNPIWTGTTWPAKTVGICPERTNSQCSNQDNRNYYSTGLYVEF